MSQVLSAQRLILTRTSSEKALNLSINFQTRAQHSKANLITDKWENSMLNILQTKGVCWTKDACSIYNLTGISKSAVISRSGVKYLYNIYPLLIANRKCIGNYIEFYKSEIENYKISGC